MIVPKQTPWLLPFYDSSVTCGYFTARIIRMIVKCRAFESFPFWCGPFDCRWTNGEPELGELMLNTSEFERIFHFYSFFFISECFCTLCSTKKNTYLFWITYIPGQRCWHFLLNFLAPQILKTLQNRHQYIYALL